MAATDEVETAGSAAKVVLTADRNPTRADRKDLAFMTTDIQDASGVFVPNATNSIAFSVFGSGQLVAVDNGDPIDTSSCKGTSRKAFSGKALTIIQATRTPGTITIEATSNGLSSDLITVEAK